MTEVLSGKGPQPPHVYWIRRALVALLAVVVVGLLVWALVPRNQPTTATPEPAGLPSASTPAPAQTPSAPASPSASASPSSTAPTACEAVGVQLTVTGFQSVKTGSKQTFSVTAENNSALPCVMQLTQDTFTLRVVSGNDPIWSTAHCEKWLPEVKKHTLKAGAGVEFKVEWGLYRSAEGCKQAKAILGAGTYVATAAYRESATDRFAFVIKD